MKRFVLSPDGYSYINKDSINRASLIYDKDTEIFTVTINCRDHAVLEWRFNNFIQACQFIEQELDS